MKIRQDHFYPPIVISRRFKFYSGYMEMESFIKIPKIDVAAFCMVITTNILLIFTFKATINSFLQTHVIYYPETKFFQKKFVEMWLN